MSAKLNIHCWHVSGGRSIDPLVGVVDGSLEGRRARGGGYLQRQHPTSSPKDQKRRFRRSRFLPAPARTQASQAATDGGENQTSHRQPRFQLMMREGRGEIRHLDETNTLLRASPPPFRVTASGKVSGTAIVSSTGESALTSIRSWSWNGKGTAVC